MMMSSFFSFFSFFSPLLKNGFEIDGPLSIRIKRDKTLVRGRICFIVFDVSKRKSAKRLDLDSKTCPRRRRCFDRNRLVSSIRSLRMVVEGEGFVAIRETDEREVSNREVGDLYRR